MTSVTTKPDSLQPQTETAVHIFDNWIDPIETEIRGRIRGFIEELIRSELDAALARPRYGRPAKSIEDTDGAACPAASVGRQDHRMAQPGAPRLAAPHACRRRADREHVSGRHQHAAGS